MQSAYVVGARSGDPPSRLIAPDVEVELGVTENFELDLDGTFFVVDPDGSLVYDGQSFWMNVKLGLWDGAPGWGVGLQVGPKLPVSRGTRGVGYEGTLLVDRKLGAGGHLTLNAGGLVDPGPFVGSPRPAGVEGGFDLSLPLGASSRWSGVGGLGGVHFFSVVPDSLLLHGGLGFAVTDSLAVALTGIVGLLADGDRYGAGVGIYRTFPVF